MIKTSQKKSNWNIWLQLWNIFPFNPWTCHAKGFLTDLSVNFWLTLIRTWIYTWYTSEWLQLTGVVSKFKCIICIQPLFSLATQVLHKCKFLWIFFIKLQLHCDITPVIISRSTYLFWWDSNLGNYWYFSHVMLVYPAWPESVVARGCLHAYTHYSRHTLLPLRWWVFKCGARNNG